jgi:GntR family transcriptional regulator
MSARPVDPFGGLAYVQIADDIARRIDAGEFTVKVPAERDTAEEYEVAYGTARRAYDVLRERGVIRTAGTRGNFIVKGSDN